MTYSISDISIIITCYKEGNLIYRAVESLKNQSIQGFEVVIVNDCSPDIQTNQVCVELSDSTDYVVHFCKQNGGLSGARNTGYEIMNGKIAMPLDADDTLPIDAVEKVLETFNKYPEAEMVFGDYNLVDITTDRFTKINCQSLALNEELSFNKLAENWILMGQSPCKKSLWKKVGGYSSKFKNTTQDVDIWRRSAVKGFKGYYTNSIIYNWFRSEDGMNNNVKESDYVLLRIDSLPFYDKFNTAYGAKMRDYIYRYFSSRLMAKELNDFLRIEKQYFSFWQRLKAKGLYFKVLYKLFRVIKNQFHFNL